MFERLKTALVKSFVGAIALGWLIAQGILHFAYAFSAPVATWVTRREYRGMVGSTTVSTSFSLQDALPDLLRSIALLVIAYVLLRWLYYEPATRKAAEPLSDGTA